MHNTVHMMVVISLMIQQFMIPIGSSVLFCFVLLCFVFVSSKTKVKSQVAVIVLK